MQNQNLEREVWHYQHANTNLIKGAIEEFNLQKVLTNHNVDDQVSIFNEVILNIFGNFIPFETVVCGVR